MSPWWITFGNSIIIDKDIEISNIVDNVIIGCNNDTQKIQKLLRWFDKNLSEPNFVDIYYRSGDDNTYLRFIDMYIYKKYPNLCSRGGDDYRWIFTSRCGRCREHAELFYKMALKADLQVRIINCQGEDHVWNEVYITEKKEWIPVDATAVNSKKNRNGFVNFDFMENKVAGDLRYHVDKNIKNGNVSYVYATYKYNNNVKKIDRTINYTDIIKIILNVTDNIGNPVGGVKVKVFSYNRPTMNGYIGLTKITNSTGQCKFEIGGGEYHFKLEKEGDWTSTKSKIFNFNETTKQYDIELEYDGKSIFVIFLENIFFITGGILFIIFLIIITLYINKKKTRPYN